MKTKNKNIRKIHIIKRRGLRRICAVVCLCFALLAVALPFSRASGKLTVSAASTTVVVPENSYIISPSRAPMFYVDWANYNQICSLVVTPTLFISRSGYYVSFGGNIYKLEVGSGGSFQPPNATYCESPYIKTTSGSTPITPTVSDKFGFGAWITSGSYTAVDTYDKLIAGDIYITRVNFNVNIGGISSLWSNYSEYQVWVYDKVLELDYQACIFRFNRQSDSYPFPTGFNSYSYDSSTDSNDFFSYVITYNGLSTSSQEYQAGYQAGKSEGYSTGYSAGNTAGEKTGYNTGYQAGLSANLDSVTPWQHIVNAVDWFFKIEILPGVKISLILSVGFGVLMLGFAIKVFLGG